ncbi:MAG TPA: glycine cleavage system protein GcvH [Acidobacteriota bacterium]|nr:glycine cleavage system protein GcvH [Acidobacteriota bacterium]HNB72997.1 glycine cleavage system protein GcvH [Acidobacteriota bacterium]HND19625.1 glycine cleavage system protein GcvH [Acidobacteriota bacterium]HNG94031.1 glycine cleavage system protein GcvH [Acidobacteriota bacterium]HNH84047.1 glycine cleavage system protein GcvH [Acidobacteriota bacterium]
MSHYPDDCSYTKDHEWIRVSGDTGRIGITYYAQESLGDVVYVDLPKVGETYKSGAPFGSVESVKAVSELFIPVSGEVLEVNAELADRPELVNNSPYDDGWMVVVRLTSPSEVDALLSATEYEDFINNGKA